MTKKTILLTNDDGFSSVGIKKLKEALSDIAKIIVVAPISEKSACGHGLTITKPLKLIEMEKDFYALDDGGPTDCVYIAMCELFKEKRPDLLISGINIGSNLGEDTTYSGTCAGAIEGSIKGIKSIAISQVLRDKKAETSKMDQRDFSNATNFIRNLAQRILYEDLKLDIFNDRKFLNINIPDTKEIKGVKITNLGFRIYKDSSLKRVNPRGEEYHWIGLNMPICKERVNEISNNIISDHKAIKEGYISITPLKLDNTSYQDIEILQSLDFKY